MTLEYKSILDYKDQRVNSAQVHRSTALAYTTGTSVQMLHLLKRQ